MSDIASLLPSGDSAKPLMDPLTGGTGSAVSVPGWPEERNTSSYSLAGPSPKSLADDPWPERLRRQVIGDLRPDPPGQILVDLAEITLEDRRESLRLGPRLLDDRGICLRRAGGLDSHSQGHVLCVVTRVW
jgi:hypothetical protein